MLRIMLVNPPRLGGIPVIREERCEVTERYSVLPPYSLLQIAAMLRAEGHDVMLIDANGWDLTWKEVNERLRNSDYGILIFRFTPTTFDWDLHTASISKKNHPNGVTVGICWTLQSIPRDVLSSSKDLDIYVRHEYESVVPSLIRAIAHGHDLSRIRGIAYRDSQEIKVNDPANPLTDWNSLPLPAYDLLPSLDGYYINTPSGSPFTIIYASKGCPFNCIYCTERNTKLKKRSAESILTELQYLKEKFKVRTVSFFDETFTIDRDRVRALVKGLQELNLGIVWYCNTRVDLVDEDLLRLMFSGGCRGVSYGIESGSQIILDRARKGTSVEQAANAIRWAKTIGIKVYCSFVFGLPGENCNTIDETISFVRRNLPTGAQFNVAVPYPGTELYDIALERGWIKKNSDWRRMYQHQAIMRTDELDCQDLEEARKRAYKTLYSDPIWWLQNVKHVLGHLEDFPMATRYALKIIDNYLFHSMVHAH